MNPYNPEALVDEIPRLQEQAELFESKAAEIRSTIAQYRVWIKEHEDEAAKKPNGESGELSGSGEEQNGIPGH